MASVRRFLHSLAFGRNDTGSVIPGPAVASPKAEWCHPERSRGISLSWQWEGN